MSTDVPVDATPPADGKTSASGRRLVLPLHAETLEVGRLARRTRVEAAVRTATRDVLVEEDLTGEHIVVEHVPIGRDIDVAPPIREEGDVTIVPVLEERIVVVRQLVLREELHLRRVRTTRRHAETVSVREQAATVTRTPIEIP